MADVINVKKLFQFSLNKEEEIEETEVSKNDKGEEIKTTRKVKKEISNIFFLRKPTRAMRDEAQLYYWVKHSECIKAGVLPKALLVKRLDNDDGVLSEREKKEYKDLYVKLFERQAELQKILVVKEENRTEEDKKNYKEFLDQVVDLQTQVQTFELNKSSIFDGAAETIARDKTIMWWTLNLAYKEDKDGKQEPFFGAGAMEERQKKLDELDENGDDFIGRVIREFIYYTTIWFVNPVESSIDFEELVNRLKEVK